MNKTPPIKGRGAQYNVHNRFEKLSYETRDDFLEFCHLEGQLPDENKTQYIEVFPKTIVNTVKSPDVGMRYSVNPYQGCEHGCVYCYARTTHEYWGYSAGLDFERKILVKKNAPELLEKKLKSNLWIPYPISLSGNTDCYQPAEKRFGITGQLLRIFWKYKHPVGIITKNTLILRDLEVLKTLAKDNLVCVYLSITSLDDATRRILEPRTATIKKRLETIRILSDNGIPVGVMMAPVIPAINSHEILTLAKEVSQAGAQTIGFTIVRLNGALGELFTDWIQKTMPDKANKVLHQIKACHGGYLNDNRFGKRMRGEGPIAEQLHALFNMAKKKYFNRATLPSLNTSLYIKNGGNEQLTLF